MENTAVSSDDLKKLMKDVAQIKEMLIQERERREMEETELTDWANHELKEARARKSKISHQQAREVLFRK